jgi:CubicO group peptidase (beta-lactamase class C family)
MILRQGTPAEAGMSAERVECLKKLGARWVEEGVTPALVLLVARRGIIVLHEAYGRLTPEPDSPPLRTDSIFPIASMTKVITAICIMQLVEDGLIGLNRPVQEYMPEFKGEGKEAVLVHHFLTHTSGLTDEMVGEILRKKGLATGPVANSSFAQYLERLQAIYDAPLSRSPGEEMSYCSQGYRLLGEMVRRVSGQPLETFGAERIFEPLRMKDTLYPPAFMDAARLRTVVRTGPSGPVGPPPLDAAPVSNRGAGGLFSTAYDMAVFGQTFLNGGRYGDARILSRPAVVEMTRNQIPGVRANFVGERKAEASWGYGWMVRGRERWTNYSATLDSPEAFGHGGGTGTLISVDPKNETVLAYFSVYTGPVGGLRQSGQWRGDLFTNAATAAIEN